MSDFRGRPVGLVFHGILTMLDPRAPHPIRIGHGGWVASFTEQR